MGYVIYAIICTPTWPLLAGGTLPGIRRLVSDQCVFSCVCRCYDAFECGQMTEIGAAEEEYPGMLCWQGSRRLSV